MSSSSSSAAATAGQRTTFFSRYYPQILVVTGVLAALGAFHLHQIYTAPPKRKPKQLRRRNATRQRNRLASLSNVNSGDGQNAATAETLARLDGTNVNQDGINSALPAPFPEPVLVDGAISLPNDEALTTMLNNAGAAARGNREDTSSNFSYDQDSQATATHANAQPAPSPAAQAENQNVLQLLYLIAEDQAKQQGYVHRGVTCNMCSTLPIRGIRYRCSNCVDFDLCESCEAQDVHPKTHLFYKVRIPAPFLGSPRKMQQPVYPGRPSIMAVSVSAEALKRFVRDTGFEQPEVEALYEQFKCLAATEFPDDPNHLGGGIDRKTFAKCFVPNNSLRPPPPNLIYDRLFAYFDTDGNDIIGFEEFIKGVWTKTKRQVGTPAGSVERYKRTFRAYDLDDDGFIERKDVLRMFRAYYALQKDLMKDVIASIDDDVMEISAAMNVIQGSAPLSAAFSNTIPTDGDHRRGKSINEEVNDVEREALRTDGREVGRRSETMANALLQYRRDESMERLARRNQRAEERARRGGGSQQDNGQHGGRATSSSGGGEGSINTTGATAAAAPIVHRREPRLREVLDDDEPTYDSSQAGLLDGRRATEQAQATNNAAPEESVESMIESMLGNREINFEELSALRTDPMDDIISDLNQIAENLRQDFEGVNASLSGSVDGLSRRAVSGSQGNTAEEEEEDEEEDHIPDTHDRSSTPAPSSQQARQETASRQRQRRDEEEEEHAGDPVVITSPSPPVIPEPDFDPAFPSTFDLTSDWTMSVKDPIRRPMKEELKLYYLEDYYNSDSDDDSDDSRIHDVRGKRKGSVSAVGGRLADDGWIHRPGPAIAHGVEREEDVGREILCQVVEQGINEMLDHLFLTKERSGLEVLMVDKDRARGMGLGLSGDDDKENDAKSAPPPTLPPVLGLPLHDPENPFSVLIDEGLSEGTRSPAAASVAPPTPNPPRSTAATPPVVPVTPAPSRDPLARARKEVANRGGPGKVSENEFVQFMQSSEGQKLGFMSVWISMGSF